MKWKLAACRINKGLKQKDVAELMHPLNMIFALEFSNVSRNSI